MKHAKRKIGNSLFGIYQKGYEIESAFQRERDEEKMFGIVTDLVGG